MMERIPEGLPHPNARITGAVYLLYFLMAFLAVFLMKGIIVSNDAAATASNIIAHEALYRSSCAVNLIANAIYIVVTALLYRLFEPVNRNLSLLAAFFSLVGCAIQIFAGLFQLAPFVVLGNSQLLNVFKLEQLQALVLLFLRLYSQVFNISLVLFALYDILLGYLIFNSMFLPRVIGALLMLAGVGWLTFIWSPLAIALSSYVLPLGALAEIFLMAWLLVKGVNISRWQAKAEIGSVGKG
jgi:hypothetical protein